LGTRWQLRVNAVVTEFSTLLRNYFPVHPIPSEILIYRHLADCDSEEAALLLGVDWTRVDDDFWRDHWSAYLALSPTAFVYYLPSMLMFSLEAPYELIRDGLIQLFNTSGDPSIFPNFMFERITLLTFSQIKCLVLWGDTMSQMSYFADKNEENRVLFTLTKLEDMNSSY
jgi:hypothetical protein